MKRDATYHNPFAASPVGDPLYVFLTGGWREFARTEPGDDPEGGGGDDPADPAADPADPADDPSDDPADPADDPADDPDEDNDPEKLREKLRAVERERDSASRRAAELDRKQKKAEREKARAEQKAREDEGEFRTLYEQEKSAREEQDSKIRRSLMESSIKVVAASLKFRNPDRAVRLVELDPADVVDEDYKVDEKVVKAELEALAKTDTYLVQPGRPQKPDLKGNGSGRPPANGGGRQPDTDDPTQWNPAETMRSGYATTDA